jgi:proteasome assembly chaperone (PAC2) family protein
VRRIGRRSIVEENSKINEVFSTEINDLVFVENAGTLESIMEKIRYYKSIGQDYSLVTSDLMPYF